MLHPFDVGQLLLPATVIWFFTAGVSFWVTRSTVPALLIAFVKAGCFLLYYGLLFDGTYTFFDDWHYLQVGQDLYRQGVGLFNLPSNWRLLFVSAGGDHFVYYLINDYAITMFGNNYYAPVAVNILCTIPIAWIGTNLAEKEFGFTGSLKLSFFIFLALFPDILAWSNIMNGKDILVLLLHVSTLYGISYWFQKRFATALTIIIASVLVLLFLRFYVPFLFAIAMAISSFTAGHGRQRLWWILGGLVLLSAASFAIGSQISYAIEQIHARFVNPLFGVFHFLLTPIPFHTDIEYGFLEGPAMFHWLMLPFALLGMIFVYQRHTPFSRYFIIYILTFFALYSIYGELQGPRHRIQLDYAWTVLEFSGIIYMSRFHRRNDVPPLPAKNT